MYNGIVNVYKEKGFTSFDVVAVMRGIYGQKKVGHTGTLDPNAEGVLPVCLGNATRLCDMLTDKRKEYVATFILGQRTDTLDASGTVLEERTPTVSKETLTDAILSFEGGYLQTPPMYSAKKIDGKRLYDLAREGKVVERKAVFVDIFEIEILSMELPKVEIRVLCGKGTYIRSLCEDIAAKVGELATMTSLIRTRVDAFSSSEAYTLPQLTARKEEGTLEKTVLPTDAAFHDLQKATVRKEARKKIDNGNKLSLEEVCMDGALSKEEDVRIYNDENRFVGLYYFDGTELKPRKMFL